jgi:hypothetical protein
MEDIEFADCFNWESCDSYVDYVYIDQIEEDPAEVALYIKKARAKSHGTKHMDQGHWSRHHGGQDKDHAPGHKKPCDHDRGQ